MSLAQRKSVLLTLAVALVFPVLAGAAAAQSQQPFFTLAVTVSPVQTIKERFGSAQVLINVTLNQQTSNPLTSMVSVVVTINRTQPGVVPNGWAIGGITPPTFVMRPGDPPRTATVDVSLTQDKPDAERVDLAFQVHSRPEVGSNAATDPLTQTLIKSMSQEDNRVVSTQVKRDLAAGEALTSFVFQYKWFILVAAAAVIVVLVLLVRRRGESGVEVATEAAAQEVVPGRGASFPVNITNVGAQRESLVLGTSEVPSGWSAILPVDRLELRGNESTTIWLTLKAPANAQPGERVQVGFIATTASGAAAETMLEATVVRKYGAAADAEAEAPSAPAGRSH